jgi:putative oxidoreductase
MLILGLGARLASALVGITLSVAALTSHMQHGFFMNWFGQQKGEGIEFFILALGLALIVILKAPENSLWIVLSSSLEKNPPV